MPLFPRPIQVSTSGTRLRWWWGWVAAAALLPPVPLLLVDVPPLLDYPNHLARLWALGPGQRDPVVAGLLEPHWALLPNLGTDLVMPWVMQVVPVFLAGRLMLAAILLLSVLGGVALSRATFGVSSGWALGTALVACHALFLFGFLNFDLSLGLAMLAAAGWFRFRDPNPVATVLVFIPVGVTLFICHLSGLMFLAILAGCFEVERCWALGAGGGWRELLRVAVRRGVVGLPVALLPVILYLQTALHSVHTGRFSLGFRGKATELLMPFVNYNLVLDVGTGLAVIAVLGWLAMTGRLLVPLRWKLVVVVLLAAFVVTPFAAKGLAWIDTRFSIMLGFCVFAGARPVGVGRQLGRLGLGVGALLLILRTGVVASVWFGYGGTLADIRSTIAPIPPGARVLEVFGTEGAEPGDEARMLSPRSLDRTLPDSFVTDHNRAALIVLDRHAFWPFMFADPAQQPIQWKPPLNAMARAVTEPFNAAWLSGTHPDTDKVAPEFWSDWFHRYDYVLLLERNGRTDPATVGNGFLLPIRQTPAAILFKVVGR